MYAPEFVFGIASAELASRYITSSLEIETIAYKISILLQSNYSSENSENIKSTAESFMHSMLEAGIENSDAILLNYQYEKFLYKGNGKIRNWSPMFGDPMQGIKKKLYTPTIVNRDFKGWSLSSQTTNAFLNKLGNLEVSAFDIITSSD
jgi:hypothetical protein